MSDDTLRPELPSDPRTRTSSPGPLAQILDLAYDAIISLDEEKNILFFNQGAERIFGYSSHEIVGRGLLLLLAEASVLTSHRLGERLDVRGRRKDGSEFPAEASLSAIEMSHGSMFMVVLRDVTQRVAAEEKIRISLREKDALLQECHHRVKNNLQVVSSLLGLQARVIADEPTRKIFEESQTRIHSMALLHESLYQSKNLSRIDFPAYIRQIASDLFHSYNVGGERIRLRIDLEDLYLKLDAAVPCGLIINELVSNSLKYAFPAGNEGEVSISLHELSPGMASLVVSDNGVGLSNDVDWITTRSVGLRLVRTLAEQLGAKMEVKSESGAEVRLTFATAT